MLLDHWWHDLRLAWVGLCRARAFAGIAILALAAGIGGATAMFALVQGVLLRPLPVREQNRLVWASKELRSSGFGSYPFRAGEIEVVRAASQVLESVAGISYYDPSPVRVVENGVSSELTSAAVTGDFFRLAGVAPLLGRVLDRGDDLAGAARALVITDAVWQRRYGGSRDVIGRRLVVSEHPFVIVGVMPPGLECPQRVEAWMTLAASASTVANPAFREGIRRDVTLIARLRPGATLEQARDELARLAPQLDQGAPAGSPRGWTPAVRTYEEVVVGSVRPALWALFGAVGVVLLIANANAANLLLMRAEARRSELAVRAALGASASRLARQLLAEGLLLAFAAGAVGLVLTSWTLKAMVALVPDGLPRIESIRVDGGVLLFTVTVAFLTAALSGLAPALAAGRIDLVSCLGASGRGAAAGVSRRGRQGLVVTQVALAVTVVAAAGLLTRSLLRLQAVDLGLRADHLVFVRLALPQEKYADDARHLRFLKDVAAQLEAAPGIVEVTPVHTPPFAGTGGWDAPEFTAEGQSAQRAAANPSLNLESIHPNYFHTFGVSLLRGRGFTEADRRGTPEVAIVSEDVAARTWPGQDPIGKRVKFGSLDSAEPWRTVVGVASPTRYRELARPRATIYLPAEQFVAAAEMLVVRTSSPLAVVTPLVREGVRVVDPDVAVASLTPLTDLLQAPLARPRFNVALIGAFGMAALLLATVGLYAVVAAAVRQRYTEIGVRVALGATASDVRALVLGEGLRLAGIGAALGLAGALMATRLLRDLLFGVLPLDPVSLLVAALLLVGVSALAAYVPARRAARADPALILRTH